MIRYVLFYICRYLVNDVLHFSTYFVIFCFRFSMCEFNCFGIWITDYCHDDHIAIMKKRLRLINDDKQTDDDGNHGGDDDDDDADDDEMMMVMLKLLASPN